MTAFRAISTGLVVVAMATGLAAQVTTTAPAGPAEVKTEQITGEVMWIDGNLLVARLLPSGLYRVFEVQPGRQFIIDGQTRLIGDVKLGTVLTATVTTTTEPVTVRTATVTNGTVWWAQGNYVVLTLANGQNRGYTVPESFRFVVDGKPASVHELKKGMKVSATKIVEEPRTEISTKTVITGKGPK
jgi:hypothetical protein